MEKVRFLGKCLFMNNFSSIKARGIILTTSCSSRQTALIHMFFYPWKVTPGQGHSVT